MLSVADLRERVASEVKVRVAFGTKDKFVLRWKRQDDEKSEMSPDRPLNIYAAIDSTRKQSQRELAQYEIHE